MRNHLGSYECRLCLTLHNNEGNYLAHTQGKRHQQNLAKRAAREAQEAPAQPQPNQRKITAIKRTVKIGRPGYVSSPSLPRRHRRLHVSGVPSRSRTALALRAFRWTSDSMPLAGVQERAPLLHRIGSDELSHLRRRHAWRPANPRTRAGLSHVYTVLDNANSVWRRASKLELRKYRQGGLVYCGLAGLNFN
jgi:hypothetical protein